MPRKKDIGPKNGWHAGSFRDDLGSPHGVQHILDSIRSPGGLNSSFTESGLDVNDFCADDQQQLGYVRGSIVGLQYYHGEVNEKEMVALIRQPDNAHDANAIKVENTWGEQVGHIKRELAKPLANICDNRLARIEGVVPFGNRNSFRMPVDISFWAPLENLEAIKAKLSRHGFYLKDSACAPAGGSSGGRMSAPMYQPKSVLGASVKLSQAEMKNQLDKLFEDIKSEDKTGIKEPSAAVTSPLYPHQKQALHWMSLRENSKELPPFWEKRGLNFLNTLTNFSSSKRPSSVQGGVLADDMGLGKTLAVISLILSNHLDEEPMFEAVGKTPSLSSTSQTVPSSCMPPSDFHPANIPKLPSLPKMDDTLSIPSSSQSLTIYSQGEPLVNTIERPLTDSKERWGQSVTQKVQSTGGTGNGGGAEETIIIDDDDDGEEKATSKKMEVQPGNCSKDNSIIVIDDDSDESWTPAKLKSVRDDVTELATSSQRGCKRPQRSTRKNTKYIVIDDSDDNWTPEKKTKQSAKGETRKGAKKKSVPKQPSKRGKSGKSSTKKAEVSEKSPNRPSFQRRLAVTAGRPSSTLIICPVSVLGNWMDQLEEHVDPNIGLKVHLFHGQSRASSAEKLAGEDVVISTYNTLAHEFKAKGAKSTLHNVHWLRVVLDEAHIIRNPLAMQTKAILELKSERQWALSGTPIQNNIKDLWSLMSFLKLEPFKTNRQWWQRIIERPIRAGDQDALGRVQKLMEVLAIRRTKTMKVDGKLLVELPPKTVLLQYVKLSEDERTMYDSMAKDGKLSVNKFFTTGKFLDHYGDILAILLRLRQLCCHPGLCASAATKLATKGSASCSDEEKKRLVAALVAVLSQGSDEECCVCLDSLMQPVITQCAHVFCFHCIVEVISQNKKNAACPLCRGAISESGLVHVPPEKPSDAQEKDAASEWHSSAKVDALMQCLLLERSKDPSIKSLVVSQFTSFLTLLQRPLREKGFNFVRLDGSMTASKRAEAMSQFASSTDGSPTVFLLSLKAGGVGINLTAASKVFLMEPAWNPAVEEQCFDRCHRLGQTKEVTVTKFIVQDSIEERMLQLQEKKRKLMSEAFGVKAKAEQRQQARIDDVRILLGM